LPFFHKESEKNTPENRTEAGKKAATFFISNFRLEFAWSASWRMVLGV
jgi:hypothetical protein